MRIKVPCPQNPMVMHHAKAGELLIKDPQVCSTLLLDLTSLTYFIPYFLDFLPKLSSFLAFVPFFLPWLPSFLSSFLDYLSSHLDFFPSLTFFIPWPPFVPFYLLLPVLPFSLPSLVHLSFLTHSLSTSTPPSPSRWSTFASQWSSSTRWWAKVIVDVSSYSIAIFEPVWLFFLSSPTAPCIPNLFTLTSSYALLYLLLPLSFFLSFFLSLLSSHFLSISFFYCLHPSRNSDFPPLLSAQLPSHLISSHRHLSQYSWLHWNLFVFRPYCFTLPSDPFSLSPFQLAGTFRSPTAHTQRLLILYPPCLLYNPLPSYIITCLSSFLTSLLLVISCGEGEGSPFDASTVGLCYRQ